MDRFKVVYWSGSGNTEAMAEAIAKGIVSAGKEADVITYDKITPDALAEEDCAVLGCPAMGDEVLEEDVVEPFITSYETKCTGKKVALFGSYGWGDGQWMRSWTERMKAAGAEIIGGEGLIANNAPDSEALKKCEEMGKAIASA